MLSHIVRRITCDMRRIHRTHNLTTNRAFIKSSSGGPIRLDSVSNAKFQQRLPRVDYFRTPNARVNERSEHMPPSHPSLLSPRVRLLLSLVLLVGLASCGPASSDKAPNNEPRASVNGPAARSTGQGGKTLIPPVATENQTGAAAGMGTVQVVDNNGQGNGRPAKPEGPSNVETAGRDPLPVPGIPESIAKALDSPDPRVRLQAMNHWEAQGTKAPLDPLFEALDDEDGYVRAKATEIIERYWAIEQERERK